MGDNRMQLRPECFWFHVMMYGARIVVAAVATSLRNEEVTQVRQRKALRLATRHSRLRSLLSMLPCMRCWPR
jgi:hypothetical protein